MKNPHSLTIDVTLSKSGKDKCNPANLKWASVLSITPQRLFEHLTNGYPMAVGIYHDHYRAKANFSYSQVIGLDFDKLNPAMADELIRHPFVRQHASFIYSTPSHTDENPRLRVVFVLDKQINKPDSYERGVMRILHLFRDFLPDTACKDAARLFFGNSQSDSHFTRFIGNILPIERIKHLADPDDSVSIQHNAMNQRLPENFIIELEKAISFTGRTQGDFLECNCPIHPPDDEPSAHWHPDKHFLYCFHESKYYLAKEVGAALGINLSDYTNQSRNSHLKQIEFNQKIEQPTLKINDEFPSIDFEVVAQYAGENEYGDAQLLTLLVSGRIVHDFSEKLWYWWGGDHWKPDYINKTPRLLYAPVGKLYAIVAGEFLTRLLKLQAESPDDVEAITRLEAKKKELEKRPKALRTHSRSQNVLKIASGLSGLSGNEWDSNPMLLGVPNGVLELETGNVRRGKLSDYIRKVTNAQFDSNAKATRWNQFLLEIFDGDKSIVDFIQRLFGYSITGLTSDHVMPVFYGRGRNGKDTLVETIGYVLGDYAKSGTTNLLIEHGTSSSQANPHIFDLMGKRLVWVTETSSDSQLNVNQVKYLTGAGRIVARPLYGNPVEFDSTHHIVLFTNHKPRVPSESEDYAIWKRLILIPLTLSFVDNPQHENERPRDPNLKQQLRNEASGILNWLIEGCLQWQQEGLNPPDVITKATKQYAKSEDFIGLFLDECCILHPDAETGATDLLYQFNQWANSQGYPTLNARKLSDRLITNFEKKRTSKGMVYIGLGLRV